MFGESASREAVVQNLQAAGCPRDFIETFMRCWDQGTPEEQLRLLACQRSRLLDGVHAEQRKLDCLDYLRDRLQQEKKRQDSRKQRREHR